MKKNIVAFLMLLILWGCSNAQPISPTHDIDCTDEMVSSLSVFKDEIAEADTSIGENETENVALEIANSECVINERTEPIPTETITQTESINTTETISNELSTPAIQQEKQEDSIPDTTPQSDENHSESNPIVDEDTAQETEQIAPKSIYDYEFDATAIRQELISIGIGMGLEVDSSLTPSNASWANPITASQSFQGADLERSLKDYVQSMPSLITAYGGEPIQYFNIYVESLAGGSYCFYFLY